MVSAGLVVVAASHALPQNKGREALAVHHAGLMMMPEIFGRPGGSPFHQQRLDNLGRSRGPVFVPRRSS
jgi:hypothetical protein